MSVKKLELQRISFTMKKMLLILLLIPLSVLSETEKYRADLNKSGCQAKYPYLGDEYWAARHMCEIMDSSSNCGKYAGDTIDRFTKECVKEYQDKPWWKKLL